MERRHSPNPVVRFRYHCPRHRSPNERPSAWTRTRGPTSVVSRSTYSRPCLSAAPASFRENDVDLPKAHCFVRELKRAVLPHLLGGAKEGAKSGAREGATYADPFDSHRREFGPTQLDPLQSHDHVDRAIHRVDHSGNILPGGKTRRIENVGACLLIGLQSRDRVSQIGLAGPIILGTTRQCDYKGKSARRLCRCAHSLRRILAIVDRIPRLPRHILD